jgi:hypothetical protein
MRQVCVTMLASLPPLGRALAAAAVPVLVAGRTLAAAEPLHRLAANLTGARGPGAQRALTPMLAPILVAGRTPPLRQPRSRASTMAAGPEERGPQWRTRRALASVATPVHLTHATAPLGKRRTSEGSRAHRCDRCASPCVYPVKGAEHAGTRPSQSLRYTYWSHRRQPSHPEGPFWGEPMAGPWCGGLRSVEGVRSVPRAGAMEGFQPGVRDEPSPSQRRLRAW